MIRDIIFDLGNVLVPLNWDHAFERLIPYLSDELIHMKETKPAAFESLFYGPAVALETGKIDFSKFHEMVMAILGTPIDQKEFRDMWCSIFTLDDRMADLAESLSDDYGAWLASNTSRAHWRYIIAKFPRLSFFKGAALSFELNSMKPSPFYFQKALELFGIDPETSVFIDDIEENVLGAVNLGMAGIVYKDRMQLLDELHALGVRTSLR